MTAHPRPDLSHYHWWPLDGEWNFGFGTESGDDGGLDTAVFDRTIMVPFPCQSSASGVHADSPPEVLWHRRAVDLPDVSGLPDSSSGRLLLQFGAVDYETTVWLDGVEVVHNVGGHVPFTADITTGAGRTCELVIQVIDRTADDQPRGKQLAGSSEPFSEIRYTASSGIWQPVWIDRVGHSYIEQLHVRAGADGRFSISAKVRSDSAGALTLGCSLTHNCQSVEASGAIDTHGTATVEGTVDHAHVWSPDKPNLYDLNVTLATTTDDVVDVVHTKVGFRTIATAGNQILLNGEPIKLRMALDQGYWPDTLLALPPALGGADPVRDEIAWLKAAGFNGVRKHTKIEDPRWWRWADELGLMVWQDMPAGAFHKPAGATLRTRLADEWERAIRRDRSHPSAICFSPFNESWGLNGVGDNTELQSYVRSMVARTRELAPDALIVDNSGWLHVESDLLDLHRYDHDPALLQSTLEDAVDQQFAMRDDPRWHLEFEPFGNWSEAADKSGMVRFDMAPLASGVDYHGQPVVISEMGGVGFVPTESDSGADPDRFVYSEAATADQFAEAIRELVSVPENLGFAGWCWTQGSDVEQEQNGLLTYDRRPKIPAAKVAEAILAATR